MPLLIHDTMTRSTRPFEPIIPGKVRMYVCGVTVYDISHVGHARKEVAFDVVYRWLRHLGYEVTYVRNFTDVDDKIIKRANERGVRPEAISDEYIRAFRDDMGKLGLFDVTVEPRATEHIPEMIDVIAQLIERGHAYVAGSGVDRDVYFSVPSYPAYGKLSHRKLEDMRAGARVEVGEQKKDPADFALWKAAKPGEPWWDSPWGKGRPGWHIECSAMAKKYLGQPFDIHGGGEDLVFPHHENEIAQSEASAGIEFARYWMHNAFVNMNSEKMSKSLGNVVPLRNVLAKYPGEVFRFFCLQAHYRSPIDFTDQAMEQARDALERLYKAVDESARKLADHQERTTRIGPAQDAADLEALVAGANAAFAKAMDEDFNTAAAMAVLFDLARALNRVSARAELTTGDCELAQRLSTTLRSLAGVLGLLTDNPAHFLATVRRSELAASGLSAEQIEAKIAERQAARKAKDFRKSDEIREWLASRGVLLEDSAKGTTWRMK